MDFSDDVIPTNTDLNNMNITELTTPAELTDNIINDTSDIIQELEPKNDQKSANKPSPQTRADHTKKITSKRRRNNIYGELTDHIAIEFLKLGGDGLLYDPLDRSWLIGVTEKTTYVCATICSMSGRWLPLISDELKQKLLSRAAAMNATPLFIMVESVRVKFYNLSGKHVTYL